MPTDPNVEKYTLQIPLTAGDKDSFAIHFDDAEAKFLLYRLAHLGVVADAIRASHKGEEEGSRWPRWQVKDKVRQIAELLPKVRRIRQSGMLARFIFADAIANNSYFADMRDGDPRLCAAAIAKADQLRGKVLEATGVWIPKTPLGAGRGRRPTDRGTVPLVHREEADRFDGWKQPEQPRPLAEKLESWVEATGGPVDRGEAPQPIIEFDVPEFAPEPEPDEVDRLLARVFRG